MRFLLTLLVCTSGFASPSAAAIDVQLVASVPNLVGIEHAGDGSGRLFLVEQSGRIAIYPGTGTQVLPTLFLDLSGLVTFSGEEGLLGLAFDPLYTTNGFFYVDYVDKSGGAGNTVIARYHVSADPNVADPNSATILLSQPQPYTNHNGGQIRFGPDGFLYIAFGDGGSGGDPENRAQDLTTLLGKLLRIDVHGAPPYIPAGNPFVSTPGARGEIWAYGLRNPWRFSFDRQTGDLLIGDVGQNLWEEVDFQAAGSSGGQNYGWRLMEGLHCYNPASNCNPGSLTLPILEYSHALGCAVMGGFRYRGALLAAYVGTYFFADQCSGRIWGATPDAGGAWTATQLLDTTLTITTFGEDPAGELYLSNYASNGGLYRLVSTAPAFTDEPVVAGATLVKAVHITELRARIDALRARFGLAQGTWANPGPVVGSTMVQAADVIEMRTALDEVYTKEGLPLPGYSPPAPTVGGPITALHLTQLRNAVVALE